nr:MAG TPA: hypothetical protein [Caudoviricetes sp.]
MQVLYGMMLRKQMGMRDSISHTRRWGNSR